MAKGSNELRFVVPMLLVCAAAVIVFHAVYFAEFKVLLQDGLFVALYGIGLILFLYFCYRSYARRDVANANPDRVITCLLAAFVCIWIGTWCSQYRADKSDGIEYKYGK